MDGRENPSPKDITCFYHYNKTKVTVWQHIIKSR